MFIEKKLLHIDMNDKKYRRLGDILNGDETDIYIYKRCMDELQQRKLHWGESLQKAREYIDIYGGKPFTDRMLARYKRDGMQSVAVRKIKRDTNTVCDNVFRGRQIGTIKQLVKDDRAIPANDIQFIIDKLMNDCKFDRKAADLLKSTMISCFFGYVEWEILGQINRNGKLVLNSYDWDCIFPAPLYDNDYQNCNDIIKTGFLSPEDICAIFPDREAAICNYVSKMYERDFVQNMSRTFNNSQTEINRFIRNVPDVYLENSDRNIWTVCDWIRPMYHKTFVYVANGVAKEEILPETYTEEQIAMWEEMNPMYRRVERINKVLWRTIWTVNGIVLYNEKHWFQNDCKLNGALFAPEMFNRMPDGFISIAQDLVRMQSAAETEGLYQIMLGGGRTNFVTDGSLKEPRKFETEMKKRDKTIYVKDGYQYPQTKVEEPNTSWMEASKRYEQMQDDATGVTEDLKGRTKASSSNFRVQTAIIQSMTSYGEFIRNFTDFYVEMTNICLLCLPYIFTREETLLIATPSNIDDEDYSQEAADNSAENTREITINKQEAVKKTDPFGRIYYALEAVANDPTRGKYAYSVVKDSPTRLSQELEAEEAAQVVSGIGSALVQHSPLSAARFYSNYPNRITRQLGLGMKRDLEKDIEKAQQQQGQGQPQGQPSGMPQDPNAMAAMGANMQVAGQEQMPDPNNIPMQAQPLDMPMGMPAAVNPDVMAQMAAQGG